MRTSLLPFCLTLLLASGGCLLGNCMPLAAQTLPPQGVPNTTGSNTPDGPIQDASPAASTTAAAPTPTGTNASSTPATPASPASSLGVATTATSAASAQVPASSSPSPSPSGTPSVPAGTQPPKSGATGVPSNASGTAAVSTPNAPADAAVATTQEEEDTVYLENADLLRLTDDNTAVLTGHVKVRYRDYTLFSDKAVVNSNTGRVEFDGNIHVYSSVDQTEINATNPATHLELDSHNNSYSVIGPQHAVVDPGLFQGSGLVLPLRVDSSDAYSINSILDVRQGGFTTCDFLHPHYYIGVRSMTVMPGKRLVARHAVLYRRGRRLFELPYLAIPLNNRYDQASYLPLVGEDPTEGYFAKFAVPYALAGAAPGILRLDYMSKVGTGTGFDQAYQSYGPNAGGTLSFYRLDDQESGLQVLTGSLVHQQSIGNFKIGLNTQFESNSYDSASDASQNLNSTLNVAGTEGRNTTLFTSNLVQNDYGEQRSSNLSASLAQLDRIGGFNTFGVKLNYTDADISTTSLSAADPTTDSTTTTQRGTLASNFDLHLQPGGLKVDLQTDLFSTIQNTTGISLSSFAGLQRRPELMLTTTGTGGDPLDQIAHLVRGSQLQFGFGDYIESASKSNTDRIYFGYDGGNQIRRTGNFTLTSDSSFQQAFYGDGGAQYLLSGRYGSAYTRGPLALSANYTTLRAYGFTPFLFDRPGDYNNANFTLGYSPNRALTISAVTAYNFLQDRGVYMNNTLIAPAAPWQNLIAIVNVHPTTLLNDQLQASYSPNTQKLFDVTNSFYAANRAGFGFRTALDFLPERQRLGTINGALDLPIILDQREQAGYKIQAIAGYNGLTSKFTYQGLALTRSWHDFEVTATYQNNPYSFGATSNIFSFTFHLKALPGYQPFGVGASGQALAGGIGQVY